MAYQVLYRTYRPQRFEEVVGQRYVMKTLLNAIRNKRVAHAYLFAGPRGTGKTTIAKLFAKAINCESFKDESCDECKSCEAYINGSHPDIIELDAASNNGVDKIREILEQVHYAPILGKYKVYIIDEVHMLSVPAFNALLKTLEEPPAHVIFILATTDPQKIIPTVLSRCQRYNFSKLTMYEIRNKLMEVLDKENITYEEKAVDQLARLAEGGMRDALSLLEQCLAYSPDSLYLNDVEHIFGLSSVEKEVELYTSVHKHQVSEVIKELRQMYQNGMDTKRLAVDLLEIIKDTLIYSDKGEDILLNRITRIEAQEILNTISVKDLLKDAESLQDIITKDRQNQNFLVYLELALIQMASSNAVEGSQETVRPVVNITPAVKEVKIEAPVETVKVAEPAEEIKPEITVEEKVIEETIPAEPEEPVEEVAPVTEENETVNDPLIDIDMELMLTILLNANRDIKIADQIIYNRFDLYKYDEVKRKYYQLLVGTELFAASKDAIIVAGDTYQKNSINTLSTNKDLYRFLNKEFGIDKMVYAIDQNDKNQLISMYKNSGGKKRELVIEKYSLDEGEQKDSPEAKLKDLFGDIARIED